MMPGYEEKVRWEALLMLVLFLLFWTIPQSSGAQVESLLIQVDGMTWNICAYNTKTAVSRLDFAPSIQEMRIDLRTGTLEFTPKPGKLVTATSLKKAIADAGYRVRTMIITVRGELIPGNSSPRFKLPDTGQRFVLQNESPKHTGKSQMVKVTGRLEVREEGPDIIFVDVSPKGASDPGRY